MTVHFKQDEPDHSNRLDGMKQGVLGKPLPRVDGLAKVTGTAPYAAEYHIDGLCRGCAGHFDHHHAARVTAIDRTSVLSMPGVIAVVDDEKMCTRAAQGTANEAPMQGRAQVCYWGQPIALVVAETFEQARDAAKHLKVEYREDDSVLRSTRTRSSRKSRTTRRSPGRSGAGHGRSRAQRRRNLHHRRAMRPPRWNRMPRSPSGTARS